MNIQTTHTHYTHKTHYAHTHTGLTLLLLCHWNFSKKSLTHDKQSLRVLFNTQHRHIMHIPSHTPRISHLHTTHHLTYSL